MNNSIKNIFVYINKLSGRFLLVLLRAALIEKATVTEEVKKQERSNFIN